MIGIVIIKLLFRVIFKLRFVDFLINCLSIKSIGVDFMQLSMKITQVRLDLMILHCIECLCKLLILRILYGLVGIIYKLNQSRLVMQFIMKITWIRLDFNEFYMALNVWKSCWIWRFCMDCLRIAINSCNWAWK
jgi:hypothetical protein